MSDAANEEWKSGGTTFGLLGPEIGATASKIGHNMETIQDKIKREQNGYDGGGRLRRDKQSKGKSNHTGGNTVLDGDGGRQ